MTMPRDERTDGGTAERRAPDEAAPRTAGAPGEPAPRRAEGPDEEAAQTALLGEDPGTLDPTDDA